MVKVSSSPPVVPETAALEKRAVTEASWVNKRCLPGVTTLVEESDVNSFACGCSVSQGGRVWECIKVGDNVLVDKMLLPDCKSEALLDLSVVGLVSVFVCIKLEAVMSVPSEMVAVKAG